MSPYLLALAAILLLVGAYALAPSSKAAHVCNNNPRHWKCQTTTTSTTTTTTTTTPTTTTTTPPPPPPPTDGWVTKINSQFDTAGALPSPWVSYNFPNSSEPAGYYLPSHAVVQGGILSLVEKYEPTGPARSASYEADGGGWYQGTVYDNSAAHSVDHRITTRMRVVSTGGVTSHRNMPLWWADSENWQRDGEEDFFESDAKWAAPDSLGREEPRSFFHYNLNGVPNTVVYWIWPRIDLSQWHTYRMERRNHKITIWVDDMVNPVFSRQYTAIELPDTLKHAVFQQENPGYAPPSGTTGSEEVQFDFIQIDVPG